MTVTRPITLLHSAIYTDLGHQRGKPILPVGRLRGSPLLACRRAGRVNRQG